MIQFCYLENQIAHGFYSQISQASASISQKFEVINFHFHIYSFQEDSFENNYFNVETLITKWLACERL